MDWFMRLGTTNTWAENAIFYKGYRYAFQGQEGDDEIAGEGNSYAYKYRINDCRLGRFFSIDPLAPEYPFYSPYAFSGNRLIDMIELEGLEPWKATNKWSDEVSEDDLRAVYGMKL
ncbi:MAG: hypothetical protein KDC92_12330 [Bacteroidetes bacterium]|nr:hypothetical protein [Bacteroidota bacterium]